MPKVFVHGNPECDAIWSRLVEALSARGVDDVVLLSPPGFGAPVPDGFEATPGGYATWLAGELDAIDGPIDLVGHDWGAGHVFGLLADRPDLVRSWAADCGGLIHPDYVWHDMAQAWQTPEVGEQVIDAMTGPPADERTATFVGLGMPDDVAAACGKAADATMGACVLTLYRAAASPFMAELGDRVAAADRPPGLVLIALDDAYVPADLAAETAVRLDASVAELADQGHWWMLSAPDAAADALTGFWADLG